MPRAVGKLLFSCRPCSEEPVIRPHDTWRTKEPHANCKHLPPAHDTFIGAGASAHTFQGTALGERLGWTYYSHCPMTPPEWEAMSSALCMVVELCILRSKEAESEDSWTLGLAVSSFAPRRCGIPVSGHHAQRPNVSRMLSSSIVEPLAGQWSSPEDGRACLLRCLHTEEGLGKRSAFRVSLETIFTIHSFSSAAATSTGVRGHRSRDESWEARTQDHDHNLGVCTRCPALLWQGGRASPTPQPNSGTHRHSSLAPAITDTKRRFFFFFWLQKAEINIVKDVNVLFHWSEQRTTPSLKRRLLLPSHGSYGGMWHPTSLRNSSHRRAHQPPQAAAQGGTVPPLPSPPPFREGSPSLRGSLQRSPHEPDIHSVARPSGSTFRPQDPGSLSAQPPQEGLPDSGTAQHWDHPLARGAKWWSH